MGGVTIDIPEPSEKQKQFLSDLHRHVAYGGARGGGKSWAVRVKAILLCLQWAGIKVLIVRKTYRELVNNHITPLLAMLPREAARYNKSDKVFTFANGSTIWFGYCASDSDLDQYQGAEYDIVMIDEATQLQEEWIKKINLAVRGTTGMPHRTYYTCNPGGAGHGYIKRLFIDRSYKDGEVPENYSFTQALVTDNAALMEMQPEYKQELEALPAKLREAWLYGRWDVYEGQFFEDFRTVPDELACRRAGITPEEARLQHRWTHVIPPIDLSTGAARGWTIMRSYDFGYAKPFSLGYWACDYDGVLYRIAEIYGCTGEPNEGVKWSPDEQFRRAAEFEREHPWLKGKKIVDSIADPSIWDQSRGESVAETAMRYGIYFTPGDNARIPGWMQVHYRLQFDENGYARMYVFEGCKAFIRTMPLMMYSETKPEDLDTTMEDHCLTGDTQVLTEYGYVPIAEMVGTCGRVVSSDGRLHRYSDVRMTRAQAEILEVELEDGTTIRCTDDHRLMLRSGEWIRAGALAAGAELRTVGDGATVKSVRRAGRADVYNMEVEWTHDFVIQGGVVSHNCADEVRYMCMSRPIKPVLPEVRKPVYSDPLNQFSKTQQKRGYI